jgi:DNA polymerase-3 subunit epsilon|tara:strand:- start:282 stop:782 length:501 start_codon:yes stop_codon:yes gene_type:complete
MNYVAIDFETATSKRNSVCSVGIVTVEDGEITEEYHALIQPPNNEYNWHNIQVHGITEDDTINSPSFEHIYPEIKKRLAGKITVAHNESFDRSVLKNSMLDLGIDYSDIDLPEKWECTLKIYKSMGYQPAKLNVCCEYHGIELQHHDALSDARGCAKLYKIALEEF